MKKLRAGIVGCGRIASEFDKELPRKQAFSHAGAYFLCAGTELVTAADPDAGKRAAFSKKWGVNEVYADYSAMLKGERLDVLSVATPPSSHLSIVREACRYPLKAIYCEKPIAESVEDARAITDLCRKKGVLLVVNHQRRFGLFYQELKKKLTDGTFGKVQQVTCHYTRGISNTCTHMIDLFIFLFGEVTGVEARRSPNASPFTDDPNLDGTIYFKSGLTLSLKALDDRRYLILETDILTTKARVTMGEELAFAWAKLGKNLLGRPELMPAKSPFKSVYPRYGMVPLDRGVEHIVRCVQKKEKPVSTGENATQALGVIRTMLTLAKKAGKNSTGTRIAR